MAVIVIHLSVRLYTGVNFWMPTAPAKRWFVERFSLLPLVVVATSLLFVLLATAAAGAVVNASPRMGLIMAVCFCVVRQCR
jgi:hypothetical protein